MGFTIYKSIFLSLLLYLTREENKIGCIQGMIVAHIFIGLYWNPILLILTN